MQVTDAWGFAQGGADVRLWVDVDDFTKVFAASALTDALGRAAIVVPGAVFASGGPRRWIHATAGIDYPLAEAILPFQPAPERSSGTLPTSR